MNGVLARGEALAAAAADRRLERIAVAFRQAEGERFQDAGFSIQQNRDEVRVRGHDLSGQLVSNGVLRSALGDFL